VAATDMVSKPFGPIRASLSQLLVTGSTPIPLSLINLSYHPRRVLLEVLQLREASSPDGFGAGVVHELLGHDSPLLEWTLSQVVPILSRVLCVRLGLWGSSALALCVGSPRHRGCLAACSSI